MSKKIRIVNNIDSDDVTDGDNLLSFLDINPQVDSFAISSNFTFNQDSTSLELSDKNDSVSIAYSNLQRIDIDDDNIKTIFVKKGAANR